MISIGHVLVGFKSLSDRNRSRPRDANLRVQDTPVGCKSPVCCWNLHRFIPGYLFIRVLTQLVPGAYLRLRLLEHIKADMRPYIVSIYESETALGTGCRSVCGFL